LGSNQPFFSIGLEPKIADLQKGAHRVEEIARELVLAIREKQPHGLYVVGGYCLSAVFAYEVARQLAMNGEDIGLLVLLEPLHPSHNARRRFAVELRRMIIRVGFRFGELC
jgi:thioesterase domain-containing protein